MNKISTLSMYVVLIILMALTAPMIAQSEQAPAGPTGPTPLSTISVAQWDLLFDYDVSTSSGQGSLAGAVHLDSTFWAAVWNEDTIAIFNNDGSFVEDFTLPELFDEGTGFIRAMTWDGTSVWAGNNTTTIHEIDPVTKTVINSMLTASPDPIRFITYDPSADSGNGAFWVGNFNTPIYLIGRTGDILTTIPADTHQLGGMYGAAYDGTSAGGPYLWVFHQAGDPSNGLITQIDLTMGTPTGAGRDVNQDLNTPAALAGGMFVTDRWDDEGTLILGGINQTTPDRLFGYELSFDPTAAVDLATQMISSPVSGCELSNMESVSFEIVNLSSDPVSDVPVEILVNNVVVATEMVAGPLMPSVPFAYTATTAIDLSSPSVYDVGVRTALNGDINNSNDLTTAMVASKMVVQPALSQSFDGLSEGAIVLPPFYNLGNIPFEVSSGPTPSTNTGPAVDANGSANFIYMESSGSLALDQAILSTECIDLTGAGDMQLGFSYHMFGAAIGNLIVSVTNEDGNSSIIDIVTGQQQTTSDAPWEERSVSLSDFADQVIEINIIGNVADNGESTFNSDIALDEILLRTCTALTIDAAVVDRIDSELGSIDLTIAGGTTPYTFLWSNGAVTEDLENLEGGSYTVEITDASGCVYNETYDIGNITSIGDIDELEKLIISPNPSDGRLQVALKMDQTAEVQLIVFDAIGQQVYTTAKQTFTEHTYQLDLSTQPSGVYWINLRVNDKIITRSITLK